MTNEEIYEKVMGHKPNKEFGVKGSFGWNDIDALMNEAVKNCSIPNVVNRRELLLAYEIYNASEDDKKNNMKYLENLVDTYLANNCG